MAESAPSDAAGKQRAQSFSTELWAFLRTMRKWWLLPIVIVLLLLVVLLLLPSSSAPFLYELY